MGRKSKISNIKGLIKHPSSRNFWFRRVVPVDLQTPDQLGKREIKYSLGSSDLRKAEMLAAQHWVKWTHHFDDIRHNRTPDGIIPTDEELATIAVEWRNKFSDFEKLLDTHEMVESERMGPDGKYIIKYRPSTREERNERRRVELIAIEKNIYDGNMEYYSELAHESLKKSKQKFSTSKQTVARLAPMIVDAEYDAYTIEMNQAAGRPSLDILQRDPMEYVSNNMTISTLLDNYLKSKNLRFQTEAEWHTVFKRLIQVVGDKSAREVCSPSALMEPISLIA